MAALQMQNDTGGQLVLESRLLPPVRGLFSTLLWFGVLAFLLLPALTTGRVDWEYVLFLAFFALVSGGSTIVGLVLRNRVVFDQPSRTLTMTRRLLTFPVSSNTLRYDDIASVEYQYYRQPSGRYSHDAWRVNVIPRGGGRVPINWDGKQDEMATLAQTVAAKTGAPVVDASVKPVSTVQQILDTIKGQVPLPGSTGGSSPTRDAPMPANETTTPALPEGETPPAPMPSWQMPAETATPSEPVPAPNVDATWATLPGETPAAETVAPKPSAPAGPDLRMLSIEALEQRIGEDRMDAEARYVLAGKYLARNRLDRAMALYHEVLQLDPTSVGAQNNLGVALQRSGKKTEAEAAYRRAIALDPFASTAHLNLGLLLRSMNKAADASQEFMQARRNARGDAESRIAEAASTGARLDPQLSL